MVEDVNDESGGKVVGKLPRRFRTAFILFSAKRHKLIRESLAQQGKTEKVRACVWTDGTATHTNTRGSTPRIASKYSSCHAETLACTKPSRSGNSHT